MGEALSIGANAAFWPLEFMAVVDCFGNPLRNIRSDNADRICPEGTRAVAWNEPSNFPGQLEHPIYLRRRYGVREIRNKIRRLAKDPRHRLQPRDALEMDWAIRRLGIAASPSEKFVWRNAYLGNRFTHPPATSRGPFGAEFLVCPRAHRRRNAYRTLVDSSALVTTSIGGVLAPF